MDKAYMKLDRYGEWDDFPESYKNFFKSRCDNGPANTKNRNGYVRIPYINKQLVEFNARLDFDKDHIEFDTEADLTMFILRWA